MNKTFLAITLASLLSPTFYLHAQELDSTQKTITPDETMVVTANRFSQPDAAVLAQTNVVTREEIDNIQAKSVVDIFRRLPSVEISQSGGRGQTASIFVRGGSSQQVLILVDGVRMPKAMVGGVDFNQIPVSSIERVEFIRGARASIYGSEAISGVINIITKADLNDNSTTVTAGIGSDAYRSTNIRSSRNIGGNKNLKVVAGYEENDGYNVHPVKGVNDGDEHGFESYNVQLALQNQFNDHWAGYVSGIAYNNEADYDNSNTAGIGWDNKPIVEKHEMKTSRVEFRGVNGELNYQKNEWASQWLASFGTQDNYDHIAGQAKRSNPLGVSSIEQGTLSWLNSYVLNPSWTLGGGFDYRHEKVNKSYGASLPTDTRNNKGASVLAQYHHQAWLAEASTRIDDNDRYGTHNTWQIAAGWQFTEQYKLTASYGTAFRAPTFQDLYGFGGRSDLNPEESKNSEVSLNGLYAWLDWTLTGYQNNIDNMLTWVPTGMYTGYMTNIGETKIKGVELVLLFDTGPLDHQVYFDYKDPRDKTTNKLLSRRSRFNAKWNSSYTLDLWQFDLSYLYQGKRFDFGQELDPYSLVDLAATYHVNNDIKVSAKVANLLDKEYETAKGYPAPERTYYANVAYTF